MNFIKKKSTINILFLIVIISIISLTGCMIESSPTSDVQEEATESDAIKEESGESTDTETEANPETGEDAEDTDSKEEVAQDEYNASNDFELMDLDGNTVRLSDYKGNIVVLNFWATWCPPCRAEIPDFVEAYHMYEDKDVQFLGLSNDNEESLKSFTEEYGIGYPTLVGKNINDIFSYWRVNGIPTTYILDGNGNVAFYQVGAITREILIKEIEKLL